MFIVPITLASWAARAVAVVESTIRRESTTVSICGRLHDPPQQRVLGADADVLGALELARRVLGRDADDHLDRRVALERLGEPAAPEAREAGDEDRSS